jgi:hypothetical protein
MADKQDTKPKPKRPFRFQIIKGEVDEDGMVPVVIQTRTVVQRTDDLQEYVLMEPRIVDVPEDKLWRSYEEWEEPDNSSNGGEEEG